MFEGAAIKNITECSSTACGITLNASSELPCSFVSRFAMATTV